MDCVGTEGARRLLSCSRLLEDAVKGPLDVNLSFPGVSEHPEKPIFHRPLVEVFDDMKNSYRLAWTVRNGFLDRGGNLRTALHEHGAVLCLIPHLDVLIQVANWKTR